MVVLMKTLQVIIALSLLIAIHELGHFIFARIFGIKVDKFFLFFDAGDVKLFSTKTTGWFTKLFPKMKDADTEYGIGWLPLGGYCKINGMIAETVGVPFQTGMAEGIGDGWRRAVQFPLRHLRLYFHVGALGE